MVFVLLVLYDVIHEIYIDISYTAGYASFVKFRSKWITINRSNIVWRTVKFVFEMISKIRAGIADLLPSNAYAMSALCLRVPPS